LNILILAVDLIYKFIYWLIIIRVIISWVHPSNVDPRWKKILSFIYRFTEPILGPIRSLIPATFGLDFSPFIALIALMIIRNFLFRLLLSI
jgi:YggT family protein